MVFLLISVVLLLAVFFGSLGYLVCYLKNERKEKSKKKSAKYNPWNGIGAYL